MKQTVQIGHRTIALRVVALYFLVATVCIVGSDLAMLLWQPESGSVIAGSIAKGLLFVVVTSFVLYVLLHRVARMESQLAPQADATKRCGKLGWHVLVPFLALALALIGVTIFMAVHDARNDLKTTRDQLETRAEFKARELGAWLKQESQNALRFRHAQIFEDNLAALLSGDRAAHDRVEKRLEEIRASIEVDTILVLDASGGTRVVVGKQPGVSAELAGAAVEAARTRNPRLQMLHRSGDASDAPLVLDQIVPIELDPDHETAPALLIWRDDATTTLFPKLRYQPHPGRTAETYLVRRAGDRIEYLSGLKEKPGAVLTSGPVVTDEGHASARLFSDVGFVEDVVDYRDVAVLAASRAVPGTDLRVITKVDLDEVVEPVRKDAAIHLAMIVGLTLLAGFGSRRLWQQQVQLADLRERALAVERDAMGKHLDLLSRYANDTFLLIDAQGRIVQANERAIERYGYPREALIGMHVAELHVPEQRSAGWAQFERVLREGNAVFEARDMSVGGDQFPVEISARRIEVDGALFVQAAVRDVSERKRAEDALRESEQRFRAVIEQSIVAIYVIQDEKIIYVNARMRQIFGYGPDEPFDPDPMAHITPQERARVAQHMVRRLHGEQEAAYSVAALRKDGTPFTLGVHAARASFDGRPAIIAVAQDITEKARAEEDIKGYVARLEQAMKSTINVIATIGELRDPYTHGHERRVGEIAAALAAEMGLDANRVEGIRIAGYLHDIGKINVPAEILAKPSRLTQMEFALVKEHAQTSYEILKDVEFSWPVAEAARQHHERLDGSGYPRGLKGEEIILEARILAVADTVEAMSSHRPYRPALGIEAALAEIEKSRGRLYDPQVADVCLRLFREKGFRLPA